MIRHLARVYIFNTHYKIQVITTEKVEKLFLSYVSEDAF